MRLFVHPILQDFPFMTKNDSHQVSITNNLREQFSNIYPADVLTNRYEKNKEIALSVPPGTQQIASSYFPPSRYPYKSTSLLVPTTTSGKNTILSDIVNAGYQRHINNRHQAHANRYQCLTSDDESEEDENIKQTVSTPTSFGIISEAYDLSPLFLASIDLTLIKPSTIFTSTPSTFFPMNLYSDPEIHHSESGLSTHSYSTGVISNRPSSYSISPYNIT